MKEDAISLRSLKRSEGTEVAEMGRFFDAL